MNTRKKGYFSCISSHRYGSFVFKKTESASLSYATKSVTQSIVSKTVSKTATYSWSLSDGKYIIKQRVMKEWIE